MTGISQFELLKMIVQQNELMIYILRLQNHNKLFPDKLAEEEFKNYYGKMREKQKILRFFA